MCGITGFIDLNVSSGEEPLKKMASSLIHRGPDGDGLFFIKNIYAEVGLAHRRLSIIDLSTNASQPMHDGDLVITFNGEIYNFNEIRAELESKGHHFKTKSDTEVILIAYREWGSGCLDRFIGMFAFVIYNKEKNHIFIARDRAGIKPFFYYWSDGIFLFGSELKSLLCHPQFKKELDLNAVAAFLQFGNIPGSNCIYKNTFKLAPGHFLEFDLQLKQFQISKYWNVYDHYNKEKQKKYTLGRFFKYFSKFPAIISMQI
jgi:asparagine synthase (glutamine-hydrolysing)